ncbi:hypothetical protein EAM_2645 [Erwinia amylovora ATCC 49946]|nr:hypothetical protein EAM01S_13_00320 [Erwinia amylovora NBRC 12687 = CFBP 1232]CBJ47319.1 hypothetical protein EAM_2645 [Erwinia amylovora ATCC 49946]CDK14379.1 hypothetical protein LA635_0755 [Erwinia amylovora LA635]CDK17746.1 hypothetical protein LA636_0754 [Erwinia amylovora LA636]CDK21115.1 hypothetical protein LA637_0755 [Erwinia amylovora LA637]
MRCGESQGNSCGNITVNARMSSLITVRQKNVGCCNYALNLKCMELKRVLLQVHTYESPVILALKNRWKLSIKMNNKKPR